MRESERVEIRDREELRGEGDSALKRAVKAAGWQVVTCTVHYSMCCFFLIEKESACAAPFPVFHFPPP